MHHKSFLLNYSCDHHIPIHVHNHVFLYILENPYIRRQTPERLVVNSGEQITLVFQAAVNSNGQQWDTAEYVFTNSTGRYPMTFTATDPGFPQHYSLVITSAEEAHAGVYTARALGKWAHASYRVYTQQGLSWVSIGTCQLGSKDCVGTVEEEYAHAAGGKDLSILLRIIHEF